jgi:lauroyl/myristoyl acyltransferase
VTAEPVEPAEPAARARRRRRVAPHVQAFCYAAGARAVVALPEALVRPAFAFGADVAWRRRGRGVRQLERNLRRVVGPETSEAALRELSREAMRSYGRYWLEFFRLPVLGADRILRGMHIEGAELLDAALSGGRGVVLALPHTGNWDHAGAWLALRGNAFTTVAERLEPRSLFDRFVAVRERLGMEVLALSGERAAFATLLSRLRAGRVVCLVSDRDLAGNGIEVQFFGERTTMPGGPAALALATGAALLPVALWFTGAGRDGGWAAVIHDPIEPPATGDRSEKIAAMTQQLADAFAHDIAVRPQDWHMLQPFWSADRRARRSQPERVA